MGVEREEGVLVIPIADERLRKVSRALSNETAVKVLERLIERPMSAAELAEAMKTPLTTLKYHIDALLDAELIKVKYVRHSVKGREVKYYAPIKRALILMPEKTEERVLTFLRRVLLSAVVIALSIPAGLVLRYIIDLWSRSEHEIPIDHTNIPWYSFVAGVFFASVSFYVLDWLLAMIRMKWQRRGLA
ncbi:MAG: ArsR/SmtB family transcription factor [Candidatus Bathyarchaeia archaeon]